jgi:3-oxoadipate enol-lactonase
MNTVEIRPGVALAYEDDCFGAPWRARASVVMIHGNAESSRAWFAWVPHLAARWRVIRPDLPGFGASPAPARYGWSVTELAADIGHFLDGLGIEKCHLVGAKYGGSACIAFASANPHRLRSLALFGSPVRGSGAGNADLIRQKGVRQWAADTMRARLGSAASEAQMRWWADELMGKTDARAALAASSARIDMELEGTLSRITVPVLIVTSQESGLQSVAAVQQYAARLPDARVIVLPGDSYHVAASEPEVCARHAVAFLEGVDAADAKRGGSSVPLPLVGRGQGWGSP